MFINSSLRVSISRGNFAKPPHFIESITPLNLGFHTISGIAPLASTSSTSKVVVARTCFKNLSRRLRRALKSRSLQIEVSTMM